MFDLTIVVDEQAPRHALFVSLESPDADPGDGIPLCVTVSPRVEAAVLVALDPQLGGAVADALEAGEPTSERTE